jgi:hypothetical protein
MKSKKLLIMVLAILVLLVAAVSVYLVIKYSPERGAVVVPNSGVPVVSGEENASSSEPTKLNAEQQSVVEDYIRENLNDFSPIRAASGTSWSLTSIDFVDANNANIKYTDGQTERQGEIVFSIDDQNQVEFSSLMVKKN